MVLVTYSSNGVPQTVDFPEYVQRSQEGALHLVPGVQVIVNESELQYMKGLGLVFFSPPPPKRVKMAKPLAAVAPKPESPQVAAPKPEESAPQAKVPASQPVVSEPPAYPKSFGKSGAKRPK